MSIALDLSPPAVRSASGAGKRPLVGLTRTELAAALAGTGLAEREAKMRASQLWNWIYVHGATDFERMSNIQKGVRQKLADSFAITRPEIVTEQVSSDGTRNGCSASGTPKTRACRRSRSRRSISLNPIAGRFVSPPRSAAR